MPGAIISTKIVILNAMHLAISVIIPNTFSMFLAVF